MSFLQPKVFYGTTKAVIAAGQSAALSEELSIQNWTDCLIQLRELRFRFVSDAAGVYHARWVPLLEVSLRIGNEACTDGFIPFGAMSWPIDVNAAIRIVAHGQLSHTSFARPVYLSPGERLHVRVRSPATYGGVATGFTPHVVAIGHAVEGVDPRSGYLPWFTGYTAVSRAAAGLYAETTDPSVFQNNFKTPLLIDRFIGNWDLDPLRDNPTGASLEDYGYGAKWVRVRCDDHLGNRVIRDATPFGVVFDQTRRYWRAKTVLASRGYFRFTLESDFRSVSPTFPRAIIGMLGFRPSLGR